MDLWIIALLVLGSAFGAGVIYTVLRKTGAQISAMKAQAQSNNWDFSHTVATFKEGAITTFSDPHQNWTMTYRVGGSAGRAMANEMTWHSPTHPLHEGACVLGPVVDPKAAHLLDSALPGFGTRLIKGLLLQSKENLNDLAPHLKTVGANGQDGLLLATPGQETSLDRLRNDQALNTARQKHAELVIIRDTSGITLRKRTTLTSMDQLSELADFGTKVVAALSPTP